MIESHCHSAFSHDSKQDPEELINFAINKGLEYLAITDHVDRDYLFGPLKDEVDQIELDSYFNKLKELKEKYSNRIKLGIGVEFGYSKQAENLYLDITKKYDYDVTLLSVH